MSEVLDTDAPMHFAVVSPRLASLSWGKELRLRLEQRTEVVEVPEAELVEVADTEHPQGVLAVVPEPSPGDAPIRAGGRYLILDSVQDPGNVGTLVRSAVAFALDGVLVLDGTADPWGPKAIRAAAGMVFRIPVVQCSLESMLSDLREAGILLLVAEASGEDVAARADTSAWALAVGNEGGGLRPALRAAAEGVVGVPLSGPAESLNVGVAAAILLYALNREKGVG